MTKKILNISAWIIFAITIVITLSFVNNSKNEMLLKKAIVNIDYETENRFVSEQDILNQIIKQNDTISNKIKDFNILAIEKKLNNNAAIQKAQVYKTIDGKIVADIKQRRPIARIFSNNESYYIDEKGKLMPLSTKYTARVLVVNGNIKESFAKNYLYNLNYLPDSIASKTLLDDIYKIAEYIDKSKFWKSQIEQMYVNKDLEFDLIPKVGNHKIVFGRAKDIDEKFNKLMVFYKKGLKKTGWNEYSKINLKYKNQVVCTKIYN